MVRQAAIIGGSVGGLATGVGLARRGWRVTIYERDVGPVTNDGDEAFLTWDRRHVPQFRQPHAFSARSRTLLLDYIPEVVEWLLGDGIEEINLFKLLAPPEMWSTDDDAYTGLWSRRPAFELAMRRTAEREPGVTIVAPAAVSGLLSGAGPKRPLEVTGVRLADGSVLEADLVIDAGGRRSPVGAWLATAGVEVPCEVQECGAVYYARYYRLRRGGSGGVFGILGAREVLDGIAVLGFPGDHDTYGVAAFVSDDDDSMKGLRRDRAWDAVMAALPRVAPWTHPDQGTPLTAVQFMGGHQNVRRRDVIDGRPLTHRLLAVGDSLCTTNPQYGWGASMALTYAFAAVEAATAHGDDPEAMALAYDDAVGAEADGVYRESSASDRARVYRWKNDTVPEWDRPEVERQDLIACVAAGATHDPVLGRALLRRTNLLESPANIFDDPIVVERARNTQAILAAKAERSMSPTSVDLRQVIDAALASDGDGTRRQTRLDPH